MRIHSMCEIEPDPNALVQMMSVQVDEFGWRRAIEEARKDTHSFSMYRQESLCMIDYTEGEELKRLSTLVCLCLTTHTCWTYAIACTQVHIVCYVYNAIGVAPLVVIPAYHTNRSLFWHFSGHQTIDNA